jgi:TolB-like protein
VLRVTTFVVLVGFPIAIVLAWAFESTPDGVRRTEDATDEEIAALLAQPSSHRWTSGFLALAGMAALLFGAWWAGTRTAAHPVGAALDSTADVRLSFTDLAEDSRPSIAVLPFINMSADEEQEHFSEGMTEEILNVLAKIKKLRVAARTSTFALKDQDLTAAEWGDTLNVRYFVEGSVRKAGDQVRITAQLIDASDGSHLWTEAYTRPLVDVFQIQAEIAEAIASALAVPLGLDSASSLVTPTADVEAYDLYLAGRASLRDRPRVGEAIKLFEAAIARDSTWAPA